MHSLPLTESPVAPTRASRRAVFVIVGVGAAVLLAATTGLAAVAWSPAAALGPFVPTVESGHIEGSVSIADDDLPAISRLDEGLRSAVRAAGEAAASDGIVIDITSGWRSHRHQQWLFDEAVRTYASEEVARQYVATPDTSRHVTGDAVDIGSLDAQLWLGEHGADVGLCQIYANERWHFELATTPGGTCPAQRPDAAG